jgi:hypothetical protein
LRPPPRFPSPGFDPRAIAKIPDFPNKRGYGWVRMEPVPLP